MVGKAVMVVADQLRWSGKVGGFGRVREEKTLVERLSLQASY